MTPYVVKDFAANTAIVISVTPKSVKLITVVKNQRQITNIRRVEFEKNYTVENYPVDKAAQKYYDSLIPCHEAATKELEEIMKTTASIITVTPDAAFIGRFTDASIAAKCSPDNSIICASADDLTANFTTAQLCEQLETAPSKSVKKSHYAEQLWENYMNKEIKMPEKKQKVKAEKAPKEPKQGAVYQVHQIAAANANLTRAEVVELCVAQGINIATARTQYQVWAKANLTEEDIIARKERAAALRPKKEKAPRKRKAKAAADTDEEIDNSNEQLELGM